MALKVYNFQIIIYFIKIVFRTAMYEIAALIWPMNVLKQIT